MITLNTLEMIIILGLTASTGILYLLMEAQYKIIQKNRKLYAKNNF